MQSLLHNVFWNANFFSVHTKQDVLEDIGIDVQMTDINFASVVQLVDENIVKIIWTRDQKQTMGIEGTVLTNYDHITQDVLSPKNFEPI